MEWSVATTGSVQLVFISSVPFQNKSLTTSVSSRALIMRESNKPFRGLCRTFICAKTSSRLYLYISSRNPKRSLFLHDRDNIFNTPIVTRSQSDRLRGVKGRISGRLSTSSSKPCQQCPLATLALHRLVRFTGDCESLDDCRVHPDPRLSVPRNRRWTHTSVHRLRSPLDRGEVCRNSGVSEDGLNTRTSHIAIPFDCGDWCQKSTDA